MGYKLYLNYYSQPSRSVVLFLLQNHIKFEEKVIDLIAGEHYGEEFLKINPAHKVPTLDDDGWILTESVAMLRYLVAKEKTPDHWYPADIKQRARVDEFMSWQHTTLRKFGLALFLTAVGKWDKITGQLELYKPGEPVNDELLREQATGLEMYLNHIEHYFLKRTDFLAGNQISIADLIGIAEIQQTSAFGYDVTRHRPKLAAWLKKVTTILGSDLDHVNKIIMELGNNCKRSFVYE